jgi:hypothetical protein
MNHKRLQVKKNAKGKVISRNGEKYVLVDGKIEFNVVQKSIAKVGSDGIIEISQ